MQKIIDLLNVISGYKTYMAGLICVSYGIFTKDMTLIMLGFTAMGIRNAIK